MKKVVLLAATPPPIGGIAAWTVRMLHANLPNEWEVSLVDEKIIGKREFFGDKTRINIICEIKRCFGIWNGLRKALREPETKVVHACLPANTLPVLRELVNAIITKHRKRVFITHFRCTVPNMVKSKINIWAVKALCNKSDCIMLLNQQSVDYVKNITKKKTVLIPNFVDVSEISSKFKVKDEIKRILYVGGVIESKGCLDIIEIAKHFPNIEFKLIGNPEEKCIKAAKHVKNVNLAGSKSHSQIIHEMREADVFMFLSFFPGEGFSNSLAEAMATGLPCIVTDWAANKDMIEEHGGVVVPVHGINESIQALKLLMDKEFRIRQSKFNINKVRSEYIDSIVQRQYVKCYEGLLNEHKK